MKKIEEPSDEEIVKRVCRGSKELYSEIIKRYQEKLLRYASYLTGNDDIGADVVQETFIKAYINLNSFDAKKKFSSWIYRIAHNEAMNTISKDRNKKRIIDEPDIDSGISLEEVFIKNEIISRTHNCLSEMSVLYKEPLSLFYLEEKSYEEISDILRIPIGTVGTRINRAKDLMKKICQKIKK